MNKKLSLVIILLLLAETAFFLLFANILQVGELSWDGRTLDQILGKPAVSAEISDIDHLNKADIIQLFFAAKTPELKKLNGKYRGKVMNSGIMSIPFDFIYSNILVPGEWEGEEFKSDNRKKLLSYKTFISIDNKGKISILKEQNTDSYIAKSALDNKDSLHLDYSIHSWGIINSEHDEVRRINEKLFICMVYKPLSGGPANPIPVVLYSPGNKK